jgi:hypothetical protein
MANGTVGAPVGNNNAGKPRIWRAAIERALAKRSRSDAVVALDELAEKLLTLADQGDLGALKELGDRLEGRAVQAVEAQVQAEIKAFEWQK